MVVAGFRILNPIHNIIERLDIDGTVDTINDIPVYTDGDETYQIVPALLGLIDWLELGAKRTGRTVPLGPLRALADCFHTQNPVSMEIFTACRALLPVLQRFVSVIPEEVARSNLLTVQASNYLHHKYDEDNEYTEPQ